MTKFEEEVMKEFDSSEYVYTAYDGTFRGETDGTVMEFAKGNAIYTFPWLEFAKNWHSDEEYQELLKENNKLKSQLQHQALPVVPEFVAEWIERLKTNDLKPLKNPETYGETGFTEEKLQNILFWISENQEDYMRAWLDGYTVEKQQLFYLREKNTNYYLNKSRNNGLELVVNPYFDEDNEFTQEEIDSMETGSYVLVPVEDGE